MAGRKPAGRRSASAKQGPAKPGSPTARPATAGQRQTAGRGQPNKGQSAGKSQGPAAAGNKTARAPSAARTSTANSSAANSAATNSRAANGKSRPAANGATAISTSSAAAAVAVTEARNPLGRMLRAAWAPFRSMGGLPLATLILSLYGLGASIYLTIAHYDTHITLACSDKGLINCEEVTTSPESIVFGIFPVAVLGLAFYVFMVAVNSPWGWRLDWPAVRWLRLGSVIAGMCFVLYLVFAELDEIHAICLWCTSVHVATFLIFALLVFYTAFSWESRADSSGRRTA